MEYVVVGGEVYPLKEEFVDYLRYDSSEADKVWADGTTIHYAFYEDGETQHSDFELQKEVRERPEQWKTVFDAAGIDPIPKKIIELSRELPATVSLEEWR